MKYCTKCKIYVGDESDWCPLCQNRLKKSEDAPKYQSSTEGSIFPKLPNPSEVYHLCVRILLMVSVIAAVVASVVNYYVRSRGAWSLIVIAAIVCGWIVAAITMRKRKSILKTILWQMVIISVICVLWDVFTHWHGWSVDFVLPIMYMAVMVTMFILNKVLRLQTQDYLIYGLMAGLFALIPLILMLTGLVRHALPSVLCLAVSVVFLAILFIFHGSAMVDELRRRSHW